MATLNIFTLPAPYLADSFEPVLFLSLMGLIYAECAPQDGGGTATSFALLTFRT